MTNQANGPWKILIADAEYADTIPQVAADYPRLELVGADEDNDARALAGAGFDAVLTQFETVDAALLDELEGVQAVLKIGRNYFNVDVDAVRERDLIFACAPRKGPNCVAELALTLILSLSKDLLVSHHSVASGAYRLRGLKPEKSAQWKMAFHWMHNTRVHEVRHKTLGILGMGEIGCELARRASVMGMRNLYYKRNRLSPELERLFDAEYRDLDSMLEVCDYVCVAVPHTAETEGMIGAEQLERMKESAFLVNIARGGVIDEHAMIEALRADRLAGAGLDVFTYEPLPSDSPLCKMDNVILTPHIGGGTGSNRALELGEALAEIERVLTGDRPQIDLTQPPA